MRKAAGLWIWSSLPIVVVSMALAPWASAQPNPPFGMWAEATPEGVQVITDFEAGTMATKVPDNYGRPTVVLGTARIGYRYLGLSRDGQTFAVDLLSGQGTANGSFGIILRSDGTLVLDYPSVARHILHRYGG